MSNQDYTISYKFDSVVIVFNTKDSVKKYMHPILSILNKAIDIKNITGKLGAITIKRVGYKEILRYVKNIDNDVKLDADIKKLFKEINKYPSCKAIILSENKKYLIHEFTHVLFDHNKDYREEIKGINAYFEVNHKKEFNVVVKKLLTSYYFSHVETELQAYLSTTSNKLLFKIFKIKISDEILSMYRDYLKTHANFDYKLI